MFGHTGIINAARRRMIAGTPMWRVLLIMQGTSHPAASPLRNPKMADTNFRPLHDRVVVRRIEAEAKTKGGIIIPDTAKEKPQEGEIVAVGTGTRDESGKIVALDVKAGDRILFGKWSGTEVKLNGEDLLIMKEADIMGVIG
jgi:chaperonin GroES